MRLPILVSSIIISVLFIMAIGKSSLAKNCEELLLGDCDGYCEYHCAFIKDDGTSGTNWVFQFKNTGPFLQLDVVTPPVPNMGCQCKATGDFDVDNVNFDESVWYMCSGKQGSDNVYGLEGHVVKNGNVISQGEMVNGFNGISYVYECEFDHCQCLE